VRICIVTGLLIPALAFAETATDNACPTLVSAAFTTAVEEREPLAQLTTAPLSVDELLFFTAIQDGNGIAHLFAALAHRVAEGRIGQECHARREAK